MNKTLLSFLVFVVGLAVFHNAIFPIFTPKEVGWILNRYVYFLLFVAYLIIAHLMLRLSPPDIAEGAICLVYRFLFLRTCIVSAHSLDSVYYVYGNVVHWNLSLY